MFALCGFLALVWTEYFGGALLFLGLFAIVLSPICERIASRYPLYGKLWNIPMALYIPFLFFDLVATNLVIAITHLVIFIQVAKLLNQKKRGDYHQMYMMSFFQLLAATALTSGPLFFVAFLLFTLTGVWALTTLHMQGEIEANGVLEPGTINDGRAQRGIADWQFFSGTLVLALASILLTAGFFYTVPRIEAGFLGRTDLREPGIGFDETVDLRVYGRIFGDSTVVFKAELPQYPNGFDGPFYWKGMSLDIYDGMQWSKIKPPRSADFTREMMVNDGDENGTFGPGHIGDLTGLLEQVIYVDTLGSSVLFGMPDVVRVSGDFPYLIYDTVDYSWRTPQESQRNLSYTAYSVLPQYDPDALRNASTDYPDLIRRAYIDNFGRGPGIGRRIVDRAREVTDNKENPYDKAVAIVEYLNSSYSYTLNIPETPSGTSPLAWFLFDTKAGHCEYFATATAVMLRAVGVPARVATGFRGGEWNEFGRFYTVRQDFSHVWVETFFPGHGWVIFDPSPKQEIGPVSGTWLGRLSGRVNRYLLSLQLRWYRDVLGYNRTDQWQFVELVSLNASNFKDEWIEGVRSMRISLPRLTLRRWHYSFWIAYILSAALIVLIIVQAVQHRLRRHRLVSVTTDRRRRDALILYRHALKLLSRKRVTKPPNVTPLEFVETVRASIPWAAAQFGQLTAFYYEIRFGPDDDSGEQDLSVRRVYHEFKRSLARRRQRV